MSDDKNPLKSGTGLIRFLMGLNRTISIGAMTPDAGADEALSAKFMEFKKI